MIRTSSLIAAALAAGACTSWPGETISDDFGRATAQNREIHTVPPKRGHDTTIAVSAEKAVLAVEAYQTGETEISTD